MSDASLPTSPPGVTGRARAGRTADVLVFAAATTIAAGFAVALNVHVGLPLPIAFAAALAFHLVLFLMHLRMGRAVPPPSRTSVEPRRRGGSARSGARTRGAAEPRLPQFAEAPSAATRTPLGPALEPRGGFEAGIPAAAPPKPSGQRGDVPSARASQTSSAPEPDPIPIVAPTPATAAAFDEILRDLARTLETHGRKEAETVEEESGTFVPQAKAAAPAAVAATAQDHLLERSVAALRAAGDAMNAYEQRPEPRPVAKAPPAARNTTTAAARTPSQIVLGEIATAIEQEQFELAVSSILGLSDQRLHHNELVMRLKTPSGDVPVPQGIPSAARGTGLVPLLDAMKAARAIASAAAFEATGEGGLVFARATGEGLMSKRLTRTLAGEPGHMPAFATRVVLTFVQQEVRGFGHAQWTALSELASQGFRFAVDDVTALDLDFPTLRNVGFVFAKIEARLFLSGLQIRDNLVGPADVHRILTSAGITLIIDRIDDESLLAPMRSYGVVLGQGSVFGRPRVLSSGRSAA